MSDSACQFTTLPWPDHDDACLWLDGSLLVLHVNAAGRRLLALHPALLVLEDGVLRVLTASPRWPQALAKAVRGERAALALPTPQRSQLSLLLEPGGAAVPAGSLLLRCRSHRLQRIDAPIARQLFDLTLREAEVASALAEGHTTATIAAQLGVQTNTVQAHAKAAMTKIGVSRQAELVATLWRSVAALPASVADAATENDALNHPPQVTGNTSKDTPDLACLGKDNRRWHKQTAAGEADRQLAPTAPNVNSQL